MDFKEIKTITYTVCAATLTVVASICGIALTAKTCGVINNCEKITKHAANVGEMIDDKQFAEDVKKDIKNATKGHAEAAEHLAALAKSWTGPSKEGDMSSKIHHILDAAKTYVDELNKPSKEGDVSFELRKLINDSDKLVTTTHQKLYGDDIPATEAGTLDNNSNEDDGPEKKPLYYRTSDLVNKANNILDNNRGKGVLGFTVDTRDPEVKSADDKNLVNNLPGGIPDESDIQQKKTCVVQ